MLFKNSVVQLLIALVVLQIAFIGGVSSELDNAKQLVASAFADVEELRLSQYQWLIRIQSNALLSFADGYNAAIAEGYATREETMRRFIEYVFKVHRGLDGEGILVIFDGQGSLLYVSDAAHTEIGELIPHVKAKSDILFPNRLITGSNPDNFPYPSIRYDRVYWNKITIPSRFHGAEEEMLSVFAGFRERIVLHESGTAFAKARDTIRMLLEGSGKQLIYAGIAILGVFVISVFLIYKLRQLHAILYACCGDCEQKKIEELM